MNFTCIQCYAWSFKYTISGFEDALAANRLAPWHNKLQGTSLVPFFSSIVSLIMFGEYQLWVFASPKLSGNYGGTPKASRSSLVGLTSLDTLLDWGGIES